MLNKLSEIILKASNSPTMNYVEFLEDFLLKFTKDEELSCALCNYLEFNYGQYGTVEESNYDYYKNELIEKGFILDEDKVLDKLKTLLMYKKF